MTNSSRIELLEKYYLKYNQVGFIENDPSYKISIKNIKV